MENDLLAEVKAILGESVKFTKSKNYYFQTHQCEKINETVKVNMDCVLHKDTGDDVMSFVRFGICSHCKEIFYYSDFTSKGFMGGLKF